MVKYNIPADHVIRHYNVTGKICPNSYVYNHTQYTWEDFKAALVTEEKNQAGYRSQMGGFITTVTPVCRCVMTGCRLIVSGTGLTLRGLWLLIPGISITRLGITWDRTGACANHSWLIIQGRSMPWTLMVRWLLARY